MTQHHSPTQANQRTRIKICGITRPQDAIAAAQAGADAIGLVFTQRSKRFLTLAQAQAICAALPPFVMKVALFMDQDAASVEQVLQALHIDLLQFHGSESADYCQQFQRPFIKALAMGGISQRNRDDQLHVWHEASGLLFDAHQTGEAGGKGEIFDWSLLPQQCAKPLILAGGLNPDNVADAVTQVRPFAVDVSSGVELAPGIKDFNLMQQFVEEVRRGDTG